MSYHVEEIPNRGRRPAILIRKAWREGGKLKKKTVGNLTGMPASTVAGIRAVAGRSAAFENPGDAFGLGAVEGGEMLDWLLPRQAPRRAEPGRPPPEEGRRADPLRRLKQLPRGPALPARGLRLQSRRHEGEEADRVRPALRRERLPRCGGGEPRQRGRPLHAGRPDFKVALPLRHLPRRPGRRPRHDRLRAHPRGPPARRHPQAAEAGPRRRRGPARRPASSARASEPATSGRTGRWRLARPFPEWRGLSEP